MHEICRFPDNETVGIFIGLSHMNVESTRIIFTFSHQEGDTVGSQSLQIRARKLLIQAILYEPFKYASFPLLKTDSKRHLKLQTVQKLRIYKLIYVDISELQTKIQEQSQCPNAQLYKLIQASKLTKCNEK